MKLSTVFAFIAVFFNLLIFFVLLSLFMNSVVTTFCVKAHYPLVRRQHLQFRKPDYLKSLAFYI